jgi:peptidyl-prolyl cis-trans isomerase SurA
LSWHLPSFVAETGFVAREAELKIRKQPGVWRAGLGIVSAVLLISTWACNRDGVGGDVMASVNGHKISRSEVDKYYANSTAGSDQQPTGEQAVSLRLSILNELIQTEILMRRAEKLGLLATDEEVDRKLNEIKAPYTAEQFNKRLEEKKISVEDFKHDLRRSLTQDKVFNKEITSHINITDQDVATYYSDHKAEFNLVEPRYHLAKIMVTGMVGEQVRNMQNKAQNDAEARKKIQMIANQLDSGGDFATLAMNNSEDPETANNGGDFGMVPESALKTVDPATRDAVMKLKPGQYTPIVPVINPASHQTYAYMIVKLIAKEPAGQRDLNDPRVQQAIRQQLRDRREQLLKAAYYESLRDDAKVTNYYADEILKNAGMTK